MADKLFKGMINPLAFVQVDDSWASAHPSEMSPEIILDYMCPTTGSNVENLIERYKEVSIENPRLNVKARPTGSSNKEQRKKWCYIFYLTSVYEMG